MLICFFNILEISFTKSFCLKVNEHFYRKDLQIFRKGHACETKHQEQLGGCCIAKIPLVVQQFQRRVFDQKKCSCDSQPPYSLVLTPCDFSPLPDIEELSQAASF